MAKASHFRQGWLWLGAALPFVLCAGCSALLVAAYSQPTGPALTEGRFAGICVEWGANWTGRPQVGMWWESAYAGLARPSLPPASTLHVYCGFVPWLPTLPTRSTFIYTW